MPKSTPRKLQYMTDYERRPEQEKLRVERNRARRHAEAEGKVKKGSGLDVDHKVPLGAGGSGKDTNTRVIPAATNRGWRKGESSYKPRSVK